MGTGTEETTEAPKGAPSGGRALLWITGMGCGLMVLFLGGVLALSFAMRRTVVDAYEIEGPSMRPDFAHGDRVLVAPGTAFQAGDVVIADVPNASMATIKRVVAIGGDTLEIADGIVIVNGQAVTQVALPEQGDSLCFEETIGSRTFRVERHRHSPAGSMPSFSVPEGHIFLLGDHRDRSNDSRVFGTIPREQVTAVVTHHYHQVEDRGPCG